MCNIHVIFILLVYLCKSTLYTHHIIPTQSTICTKFTTCEVKMLTIIYRIQNYNLQNLQ